MSITKWSAEFRANGQWEASANLTNYQIETIRELISIFERSNWADDKGEDV